MKLGYKVVFNTQTCFPNEISEKHETAEEILHKMYRLYLLPLSKILTQNIAQVEQRDKDKV